MKKLIVIVSLLLVAGCAHQQASVTPQMVCDQCSIYHKAIIHTDSLEAAGKIDAEHGLYLRSLFSASMGMWLNNLKYAEISESEVKRCKEYWEDQNLTFDEKFNLTMGLADLHELEVLETSGLQFYSQ